MEQLEKYNNFLTKIIQDADDLWEKIKDIRKDMDEIRERIEKLEIKRMERKFKFQAIPDP